MRLSKIQQDVINLLGKGYVLFPAVTHSKSYVRKTFLDRSVYEITIGTSRALLNKGLIHNPREIKNDLGHPSTSPLGSGYILTELGQTKRSTNDSI